MHPKESVKSCVLPKLPYSAGCLALPTSTTVSAPSVSLEACDCRYSAASGLTWSPELCFLPDVLEAAADVPPEADAGAVSCTRLRCRGRGCI